jgi:hypothetical protein
MRLAVVGALFAVSLPSGPANGQRNPGTQTAPDTLLLATRCQVIDGSQRCVLWGPSLVELIARPELYDGRRVRVIGFINFEFEGDALFLSSEDWKHGVVTNSLWVEPPPGFESDSGPARKQHNRRYVIIEGTFNARKRGHLGLGSGAIEHVTRLDSLPTALERQ